MVVQDFLSVRYRETPQMNRLEFNTLWNMPHLAQLLYHAVKHRCESSDPISWNSLADDLRIDPSPGRKSYKPTRQQMRYAASLLVAEGLITPIHEKSGKLLKMECPMADPVSLRAVK